MHKKDNFQSSHLISIKKFENVNHAISDEEEFRTLFFDPSQNLSLTQFDVFENRCVDHVFVY